MDNHQNSISLESHNQILEQVREQQLEYKNKIIELQKQKQYEVNRANDFQQKFKEALLSTGSGNEENLIEKLCQRETEANDLRMEIFELKKELNNTKSVSTPTMNQTNEYSRQDVSHLIHQNEEMAKTIDQLKNAAISAIMSKDEEIEEVNQKLAKAQQIYELYELAIDREEGLEKQIEKIKAENQEQVKTLNDKIYKEREKYVEKIEEFQANLQSQQSSRHRLLEKATDLEDNLENKDRVIELYEQKIQEYEAFLAGERQKEEQKHSKLQVDIENLKDKIAFLEKEQKHLQKLINESKTKEKSSKILADRQKEEIAELNRKLTIKKRKNNPNVSSSQIYSSFQGISQKSAFYSSFYKPTQSSKPENLGQIEELDETDIIENFIDLQDRNEQKNEPLEENSMPGNMKKKTKPEVVESKELKPVPTLSSKAELKEAQIQSRERDLQLKLSQTETALKENQGKFESCQRNLEESSKQIEKLNTELKARTAELKQARQDLIELRSQNQRSLEEKEQKIELENLRQHVFKLENALLIQKLQNAEKDEFNKERRERERKNFEEKIEKLESSIKSPKKKKGFFG